VHRSLQRKPASDNEFEQNVTKANTNWPDLVSKHGMQPPADGHLLSPAE
jgi:hypothetical protein